MNRIKHIAIIPDGNRRWAKEKNKSAQFGHKKGAEKFKEILKETFDLNIKYLTFWGTSVSNIKKRNKKEVKFLFNLFQEYFEKLASNEDIHKNKARVRVLGTWEKLLPENVKSSIKALMSLNQQTMYTTSKLLKDRSKRSVMPGIVSIVTAVLFTLLFNFFIHHYVAKPIVQITKGIEDFNEYGKEFNVEIETNDELKRLAEAINNLLHSSHIK